MGKLVKRGLGIILFLLVISLYSSTVFGHPITIKYTTAKSPRGFVAFWDIDFIIIYNINNLSEYELNQILIHEYTHQLCWELFGIYPKNVYDHDERCFTGKGSLLIS